MFTHQGTSARHSARGTGWNARLPGADEELDEFSREHPHRLTTTSTMEDA